MTSLEYTVENIELIQNFLDDLQNRLASGIEITWTKKASEELQELSLSYDITLDEVEEAIKSLTIEDYYQGIDPSNQSDFKVCAFSTKLGRNNLEIYLKFGLEVQGLQILLFSNHIPDYPMRLPFRNYN